MKAGLLIALAALNGSVLAAPSAHTHYARHEHRNEASQWTKRQPAEPDLLLPMRIGLTQNNLDVGHDLLMEISDPDSPRYGQHYTVDEVHDLFAPSDESVAAVYAWLEESGISLHRVSQSVNKQWLQFDAQTVEVEDLLKAKFYVYDHESNGKTSIGCEEYHVKKDIQHHIDYITPGVRMLELRPRDTGTPSPRTAHTKRAHSHRKPIYQGPAPANVFTSENSLEYCDSYVTPACIRAMYNISLGTTAVSGNELGIYEESPDASLDSSDMNLFYSHVASFIPNGTFPTVYEIDGAQQVNSPKDAGTETLLDFQVALPVIYPQKSIMYLVDSNQQGEYTVGLFNTFLDAIDGSYCTYEAFGEKGDNNTVDPHYPGPGYEHKLQCGVFKPTNVISSSQGLTEFLSGTTANYQKRQCNEYMKLGLRGHTFVFASGDAGVGSSNGCAGTNKQPIFNPDFPVNCPYVLAVGSTTLTGKATEDAERATTLFGSGGGFSNFFPQPSYQAAAVKGYFESPNAPTYPYYTGPDVGKGYYNRSGRGFPDVSSVGQALLNWGQGEPYLEGGTSAAAPLWSAVLNRVNEERLKANMSTIGFVNPTLYKNPRAMHDITVGNNPGCGTKGFSTAVGWDPVTGLGTPNYPALLEVFMKAPSGKR